MGGMYTYAERDSKSEICFFEVEVINLKPCVPNYHASSHK